MMMHIMRLIDSWSNLDDRFTILYRNVTIKKGNWRIEYECATINYRYVFKMLEEK